MLGHFKIMLTDVEKQNISSPLQHSKENGQIEILFEESPAIGTTILLPVAE